MIDLGTIRPGRTLRIPFSTFDKDDGSSITMTNYAVADILIYKDGSTTERASTAGFTATTDFDSKTGKHVIVIDLADNTTAGFFAAGSEYMVAIDAVTVDAVTTGGWIARFRIGHYHAVLNTTIATLSTQTSFTLTEGPAEDDALNGMWCIIHDVASAVQWGWAIIDDYTGSTKTVTLVAGTTFTAAATDNISVMGPMPMQPTTAGRKLDVSTGGEAGVDWANVGNPTTTLNLSGTTVKTATDVETDTADIQGRLPAALVSGRMDSNTQAMANDVITSAVLAASAITEIQSGLSTLDAAGIRTAVGLASANLDTQLAAIDDYLDTELAAVKAVTDQMAFGTANRLNVQVYGMEAGVVTAAAVATGAIDADALATDAVTEIVTAVLTTQMTESYRATNAAPTLAQSCFELIAHMGESSISSTTKTLKKIDGSTTAKTYTLNSATTPTSITETT